MPTIPYAPSPSGSVSRELQLSSWFNVRDLGGLDAAGEQRLRAGRLLRSDAPVLLSPEDIVVLRGMGVRTAVDLRTPEEAAGSATVWEQLGVQRRSCPVVDVLPSPEDWPKYASIGFTTGVYLDMLEDGRAGQPYLWRALAEATTQATVVHCASGRDRTGVVVALLLSVLGVPREQVVDDYARSAAGMQRMLTWLETHRPDLAPATSGHRRAFAFTPAQTMERFLTAVDERYGGPVAYVDSLGVDDAVAALRENLLERPNSQEHA